MRLFVRLLTMQDIFAPVGLVAEIALTEVPGVSDVRTENEDQDSAVLSYEWNRYGETFQETDAHFLKYHFKRDWDFETVSRDPLTKQQARHLLEASIG